MGTMEMEFSKRLDLFGPEIFAALNDKKIALEAEGRKLYNLSVGTPDFAPAPHIKQALLDQGIITRDLYEKAKARIVSGQ